MTRDVGQTKTGESKRSGRLHPEFSGIIPGSKGWPPAPGLAEEPRTKHGPRIETGKIGKQCSCLNKRPSPVQRVWPKREQKKQGGSNSNTDGIRLDITNGGWEQPRRATEQTRTELNGGCSRSPCTHYSEISDRFRLDGYQITTPRKQEIQDQEQAGGTRADHRERCGSEGESDERVENDVKKFKTRDSVFRYRKSCLDTPKVKEIRNSLNPWIVGGNRVTILVKLAGGEIGVFVRCVDRRVKEGVAQKQTAGSQHRQQAD